jgi:hypothetical protein
MRCLHVCAAIFAAVMLVPGPAAAQTDRPDKPTWWAKYQVLAANGPDHCAGQPTIKVGANVDVSNECGPQSETFVAINPSQPKTLAGGSNEIFRLAMRGYFSTDAGNTWGGVDLPLPSAKGNGFVFASDPSLAFDTRGSVYYSYINVYVGHGNGINGTSMGVARSTDGGRTYPQFTEFSLSGGSDHFNDKPMITVDTNLSSPFRDSIYVAWDAAAGGSSGGGVRFARSTDHGATFTVTRIDNPGGPGRAIGAQPFVGPNGEVYAAWNDFAANAITINRSLDGGVTWGQPVVVSAKTIPFDIAVPAEMFRGALVYPSCGADRSSGAHRGRLYCSWMDLTAAGNTDIKVSFSDDGGSTWSAAPAPADALGGVDRFNHWLAVDPVTGDVNVSFYDTRNDTTGARFMTDIYFSQSRDGAASWVPNVRVSDASSNEHDCNGVFPCGAIDYGNQTGDYAGLASFGGVSYPIWTDSRSQLLALPGCRTGVAMEEVFTAAVVSKR